MNPAILPETETGFDFFLLDYRNVIRNHTDIHDAQIENQLKALQSEFETVKYNHKILDILADYLENIYIPITLNEDSKDFGKFMLRKCKELRKKYHSTKPPTDPNSLPSHRFNLLKESKSERT